MNTNLTNSSANVLAKNTKQVSAAGTGLRLLKTACFAVVIAATGILFICLGIPWYIGAVIIAIAPLLIILDVISLIRNSDVRLDETKQPELDTLELEADEVLTATIPAVKRFGAARSNGVMGAPKVIAPENALIITNKAIWALTVPLQGVDKIIGGTDMGKWQWMSAYEDIINGLNRMVSSLPFEEVLKQGRAKRLMKLEELQSAKALPYTYAISFARADGKKFGYSIRLQEDFERAKVFLGIQ
ncbi:hypothetical protein [Acetanaerobacterium elongatum]|uniref:Uncharacterized protein n=1 Tax=Acetanaerobacterium elongatum TaxID=258515 RepID=A0A1H0A4H8_9FIRM|nr:hypothetical protein [Acetanaerobacterium elongatum]SDN28569.1 hypothetical protein SAMN05192585_11531 [Acetanaerobacterium elongatum]